MPIKTKLLGGTAALALLTPLAFSPASSAEPQARAAATSVTIVNESAFSPATVRIKRGRRVNWSWAGQTPHNVVFSNGASSSTGLSGTYSRKFKAKGRFTYVCSVHGFGGKVVVK